MAEAGSDARDMTESAEQPTSPRLRPSGRRRAVVSGAFAAAALAAMVVPVASETVAGPSSVQEQFSAAFTPGAVGGLDSNSIKLPD